MAFPAVASHAETSITTPATSFAVTLPSGIASGDRLVIVIGGGRQDASDFAATGWTSLIQQLAPSSNGIGAVFYRDADGSEGSTATVTRATSGECPGAIALRITGHDSETPPEAVAFRDPAIQPESDPPSLGPSWGSADTLWIAASYHNAGTAISAWPTSYADNQLVSSGSGTGAAGVALATRELAASSDDPAAFSWSNSNRGAAFTIAIKPGGLPPLATISAATTRVRSVGTCAVSFGTVPGPRAASDFIAPDSAISGVSGAWQVSGAATLLDAVSEWPPNDSDVAYHVTAAEGESRTSVALILGFDALLTADTGREWVLRMRAAAGDGAGGVGGGAWPVDLTSPSFRTDFLHGVALDWFVPGFGAGEWRGLLDEYLDFFAPIALAQRTAIVASEPGYPTLGINADSDFDFNVHDTAAMVSGVVVEILGEVAATPVPRAATRSRSVGVCALTFGAAPQAVTSVGVARQRLVGPAGAALGTLGAGTRTTSRIRRVAACALTFGALATSAGTAQRVRSVAPASATVGAASTIPATTARVRVVGVCAASFGSVDCTSGATSRSRTTAPAALSLGPLAVGATGVVRHRSVGVAGVSQGTPTAATSRGIDRYRSVGVCSVSLGSLAVGSAASSRERLTCVATATFDAVAAVSLGVPRGRAVGVVPATFGALSATARGTGRTRSVGVASASQQAPHLLSSVSCERTRTVGVSVVSFGTLPLTAPGVARSRAVAPAASTLGALAVASVPVARQRSVGTCHVPDLTPHADARGVARTRVVGVAVVTWGAVDLTSRAVVRVRTVGAGTTDAPDAAVRASRWTLASGPPVSAVVASGPPVTATLASGPPVSARLS